jgi:hypothetical protein
MNWFCLCSKLNGPLARHCWNCGARRDHSESPISFNISTADDIAFLSTLSSLSIGLAAIFIALFWWIV